MTPHVSDEAIERIVAGEPPPPGTEPRAHLAVCAECRERVERATREAREIDGLLRAVDHPAPKVGADAVVARVRRDRFRMRWAAGLLLAAGLSGAAWAVPGSPIRAALEDLAARIAGPAQAPEQMPAPAQEELAGIAIRPEANLVIEFPASPA
ncbi:MAG: hypothetical protein ACRENB_04670, partial [Gemmatimonadales bacterium]